jgi:hypothetical protein
MRKQHKLDLVAEIENWKKEEAERKNRNKELEALWKTAVAELEAGKAVAKANRMKIKDLMQDDPRPNKNDPEFKQEKAIPKPKLPKAVAATVEESDGEEFSSVDSSDEEE